jgi:glycosyltransferase involved in cell wall biosynthesis
MKVYVNRSPVNGPWGGGNHFVKAVYDYAAPEIQVVESDPDAIIIVGLDQEENKISAEQAIQYKLSQLQRKNVKLIIRVNENDARKSTNHVDNRLLQLSKYVDLTIFVSEWIMDYFMTKGWQCQNNKVIKNGVDQSIFYKKDNSLVGSKIKLVTHHWSNNPLKGFDIYDKLDSWITNNRDFEFCYIGRERSTFKNSKVVPPLFGKDLGDELRKHDVYISASRNDPGPNHVIESIACGLPTYVHVKGGGCVEFAGKDYEYDSWEALEEILLKKEFIQNKTTFSSWKDCINHYKDVIINL